MAQRKFVSEPLDAPQAAAALGGEPQLPSEFRRHDETITVKTVRRTWRSTKTDRGDVYLKRHWFEFAAQDGRVFVVYFDRAARRGAPHWWLYSIEEPTSTPAR